VHLHHELVQVAHDPGYNWIMVKSSSKKSPALKNRVITVYGRNLETVVLTLKGGHLNAYEQVVSDVNHVAIGGYTGKGASKSVMAQVVKSCRELLALEDTLASLGALPKRKNFDTIYSRTNARGKRFLDMHVISCT